MCSHLLRLGLDEQINVRPQHPQPTRGLEQGVRGTSEHHGQPVWLLVAYVEL